jgi:hypothetical protein
VEEPFPAYRNRSDLGEVCPRNLDFAFNSETHSGSIVFS